MDNSIVVMQNACACHHRLPNQELPSSRFESRRLVRPVTEGLVGGLAAAAERGPRARPGLPATGGNDREIPGYDQRPVGRWPDAEWSRC